MALNPDVEQELLAQEKSEIFFSIAEYLQSLVVDSIYEGDYDQLITTDPTQWTYNKLKTIAGIVEQAEKSADDIIGLIRPAIEDVVQISYTASAEYAASELIGAGKQVDLGAGWQGLSEYAIDALADGLVNRMEKRVNKLAITSAIQNDTTDYIERIVSQVVGGRALSDAQAEAVDELIKRGVSVFKDARGKMWSIENYVPMYMRTASQQARVQGALDTYGDASQYLVYISDSPAECPYCRKYEGKVFRTTDDLEKLPEGFRGVPHLDEAKNAKPVGLFHPNCTHQALMYVDGLTDLDAKRDPDDTEFHNNRNEIRRVQKNKRRARASMKHFKKHGQTAYYNNAKANYNKWLKEEKAIMSYFERQGLGWLGTDQQDVLLAQMAGVPEAQIKRLKNNPFALIELQAKQKFPTKLVSTRARDAIQEVLRPPDISTMRVDNLEQLSRKGQLKFKESGLTNIQEFIISDFTYLSEDVQKALNYEYYKYFEGDYGVYAYGKKVQAFHAPPNLPSSINSKARFDKFVADGGQISNKYGYWVWEEGAPAPVKHWHEERKLNVWDKIVDRKLAEEEAAGALRNKKQYVSGGLPSSGKTRTISGKDPNKTIKTVNQLEYVTLNSDDFKTMLIIDEYATDADKAIHEAISDVFIEDDLGANTRIKFDTAGNLLEGNEVWNDLKKTNRDVFDALFGEFEDGVLVGYKENHTFNESFLTEVKETIANRTVVLRTTNVVSEIIGFEAANFVHSESSSLLEYARNKAGQQGFNIIHDVTMGSGKPITAIDNLIQMGYKKAEGTFIIYTAEQARQGVVQRYAEGNFSNLSSKIARGRGGRYVSTGVIDSATELIKTNADETIDLLGRPAINDNEIFFKRLLDAGLVDTRQDGIQIIDRTLIDQDTGYPLSRKLRLLRGKDGIKALKKADKTNTSENLWGLVEETEPLSETQSGKPKVKVKAELPQNKLKKSKLTETYNRFKPNFTLNKVKGGMMSRINLRLQEFRQRFTDPLSAPSYDLRTTNVFGEDVPLTRSTIGQSIAKKRSLVVQNIYDALDEYKLGYTVNYDINRGGKFYLKATGLDRPLKEAVVKSLDDAIIKINATDDPLKKNHYIYIMPTKADADVLFQAGVSPNLIFVGDSKVFETTVEFLEPYLRDDVGYFGSLPINKDLMPVQYTPLISEARTVADELIIPPIVNEEEVLFMMTNKGHNLDEPLFDKLYTKSILDSATDTGDALTKGLQDINDNMSTVFGSDITFYSSVDAIAHLKSALGLDQTDNLFELIIEGRIDPDKYKLASENVKLGMSAIGTFTNESTEINRAVVRLKKLIGMNYQSVHNIAEHIDMLDDVWVGGSLQVPNKTTASDDIKDLFELMKQTKSNERYIDADTGEEFLFSIIGKHIPDLDDDGSLQIRSPLKVANNVTGTRNRHVTDFINVKTKRVKMTVREFIKQVEYKKLNTSGETIIKKADKKSTINKRKIKKSTQFERQENMMGLDSVDLVDVDDLVNDPEFNQAIYKIYDGESLSTGDLTNATSKDYRLLRLLEDVDLDAEIEVALVAKADYDEFLLDNNNPMKTEFIDAFEDFDAPYITEKSPRMYAFNLVQRAENIDMHIYGQGNRANSPIKVLRGDNLRLNTNVETATFDNDFDGLHRINQTSTKATETLKLQVQSDDYKRFVQSNSAQTLVDPHKDYYMIRHNNIAIGTTQATTATQNISGKKVILQVAKQDGNKIDNILVDLEDFEEDVRNGMFDKREVQRWGERYIVGKTQSGKPITDAVTEFGDDIILINNKNMAEFKTIQAIRKVIPVEVMNDRDLAQYLFVMQSATTTPGSSQYATTITNLEKMVQFSEDVTLREMIDVRLQINSQQTQSVINNVIADKPVPNFISATSNQKAKIQNFYDFGTTEANLKNFLNDKDPANFFTSSVDANFVFKDKIIDIAVGKGYISQELKDAVDIVDRALAKFGGINAVNITQEEFIELLRTLKKDPDIFDEFGQEFLSIELPPTLYDKLAEIQTFDLDPDNRAILLELKNANGEEVIDLHNVDPTEAYRRTGRAVPYQLQTNTNNKIADFIYEFRTLDETAILEDLATQGADTADSIVPNKNNLFAKYATSADINNVLNKGIQSGELLDINLRLLEEFEQYFGSFEDVYDTTDELFIEWQRYKIRELKHGNLFNLNNLPIEIIYEDLFVLAQAGVISVDEAQAIVSNVSVASRGITPKNKYTGNDLISFQVLKDNLIKNTIGSEPRLLNDYQQLQNAFKVKTDKLTVIEPLAIDVLNDTKQKNTKLVLRYGNEVGSDILDIDNKQWTDKLVVSEKGNVLLGLSDEDIFETNTRFDNGRIFDVEETDLTRKNGDNLQTYLDSNLLVGQTTDAPSIQAQNAVNQSVLPQASEIQLGSAASTSSKSNTAYEFSNSGRSNIVLEAGDNVYYNELISQSTVAEYELNHTLPVRHISRVSHEYEYIIPSDAKFEVMGTNTSPSFSDGRTTVNVALAEKQFQRTAPPANTYDVAVLQNKQNIFDNLSNYFETVDDNTLAGFDNGVVDNEDVAQFIEKVAEEERLGGVYINPNALADQKYIMEDFYFEVLDTLQINRPNLEGSINSTSFQVNLNKASGNIQIIKALTSDDVIVNIKSSSAPDELKVLMSQRLKEIREVALNAKGANKENILSELANALVSTFVYQTSRPDWSLYENTLLFSFKQDAQYKNYINAIKALDGS